MNGHDILHGGIFGKGKILINKNGWYLTAGANNYGTAVINQLVKSHVYNI